ncbi:MAG: S46 family peptidase, partial [Calditrichia bacterium]
MLRKLFAVGMLLTVCSISLIRADEGMWLPHQIAGLNLAKAGLEMNPEDLYKMDGSGIMSAVVRMGGGTAEFVSEKGLLLTNHHVAYGALQRASDSEHDYLQNGYLAETPEQEIIAPGYHADVLRRYEEVTGRFSEIYRENLQPEERRSRIDHLKKQLAAEAESQGPDIHAGVVSMYSGNQYFLFIYKRLQDIRLVYA